MGLALVMMMTYLSVVCHMNNVRALVFKAVTGEGGQQLLLLLCYDMLCY